MDQDSIFGRVKVNYTPPAQITHLVSSNSYLALALKNGRIQTIPLDDITKECEFDLPMAGSSRTRLNASQLFLDLSGEHLIISTEPEYLTFYLSKKENKLKRLDKLEEIITAVGWNPLSSTAISTGFILLGTSQGRLSEVEISNGTVSYSKELFTTPNKSAITSIQLQECNPDDSKDNRWMVLFASANRIYTFMGKIASGSSADGYLYPLFVSHKDNSIDSYSVVGTGFGGSQTADYQTSLKIFTNVKTLERTYAWLQNNGIQYGAISCNATEPINILANKKFYNMKKRNISTNSKLVHMELTEYHIVLAFSNRLQAVCTLNESLVYEDNLQKFGSVIGMCRDPKSQLLWVYSDKCVLKYTPTDETKHLWSIYLDIGDYNMARKFAVNPKHQDIVLLKQCSKLMEEKKHVAAAEIYAMTMAPMEDVTLKLLQVDDKTALKTYLQRKLNKLEETEHTQKAMIVLWLLEVLLTELDEAKCGLLSSETDSVTTSASVSSIKGFDPHKTKDLRNNFKMFLNKMEVVETLKNNQQAAFQIMSSHGDFETRLYFSELIKEYESVLDFYIKQERYEDTINVLQKQKNSDLIYKFSGSLLTACPKQLIDVWIAMGGALKPKHLLACCFQCDSIPELAIELIRYFEHCVDKLNCYDPAVHNYLLSLYTKHDSKKVLSYLQKEGKELGSVRYDVHFGLRVCLSLQHWQACVFLYCLMQMYDEAMDLALKEVGHDAAKTVAKSPDNPELQRKLWLIFARHVIEKDSDIRNCVALLHSSGGLIKIQDLLPFFPDFVTIDNFRDCLCDCLSEHSGTIKNLQIEMKEAAEVSQQIKSQIAAVNERSAVIKAREKCSSCDKLLTTSNVYAFLCSHNFHRKCLEIELMDLVDDETKQNIEDLETRLTKLTTKEDSISTHSGTSLPKEVDAKYEELLCELEEFLTAECPFCGTLSVEHIDKPFFTPFQYASELKKWE